MKAPGMISSHDLQPRSDLLPDLQVQTKTPPKTSRSQSGRNFMDCEHARTERRQASWLTTQVVAHWPGGCAQWLHNLPSTYFVNNRGWSRLKKIRIWTGLRVTRK